MLPSKQLSSCTKIDILPKESVSAEGQKDQINAERLSAEFLQKLSAEILQKDLSGRPLLNDARAKVIGTIFFSIEPMCAESPFSSIGQCPHT